MNKNMTVKDLKNFVSTCEHVKRGFCCQQESPNRNNLKEIGSNYGLYGWNWTIYYDNLTDTAYISAYRNVPNSINER